MFGLKLHRATTQEATPLEATQKILDGFSEFAAWAMFEVRHGVRVARHPGVTLGGRVFKQVKGLLQDIRAQVESNKLCSECKQARRAIRTKRDAPTEYPDQTAIHLGPHPVDHHPILGGIHVHPAPTLNPGGNRHPRSAPRHH